MDVTVVLEQAVELFVQELGDDLAGVYLHGSLAMGCFNPAKSDVDLLLVVHQTCSKEQWKRLAKRIIAFQDNLLSGRGLELSAVLASSIRNFVYPPPFEFHYSDFHREKYIADENYFCGGFGDPDLAAHYTVIYHRGRTLYGMPIREMFRPIDRTYVVQALLHDVREAVQEINKSPLYYTLNLCRVLYYLQEGVVSSKQEGGKWGLHTLPPEYRPIVEHALHEYAGANDAFVIDNAGLAGFAEYMLGEITLAVEGGSSTGLER